MVCNPILASQWHDECPDDWAGQMYAFYCTLFVWMSFSFLSIGGHLILRHIRAGEIFNFSIFLAFIELIGIGVLVTFFLLNVLVRGETGLSDPVSWFFISFPFYVNEVCSSMVTIFLTLLTQKKMTLVGDVIMKTVMYSSFFMLFLIFPLVLLGKKDLTSVEAFQIFTIPLVISNFILLCLQGNCVLKYRAAEQSGVVRVVGMFFILRFLWCIILVVHLALYEWGLDNNSSTVFFFFWPAQFTFIGLSGQFLGAMGVRNEITESAIRILQPEYEVELDETGAATVVRTPGCKKCVWDTVDFPLNTAEELLWEKPLESIWDLFAFPNPVNEVESRTTNGVAAMYVIAIFIVYHFAGPEPVHYLYIISFIGWTLRVMSGPKLDPHFWLVLFVVRRLPIPPDYAVGFPKRISQGIGAIMTLMSYLVFLYGYEEHAMWILAFFIALLGLYVVYGICATCVLFYIGLLTGIIPMKYNIRTKFVNRSESASKSMGGSGASSSKTR